VRLDKVLDLGTGGVLGGMFDLLGNAFRYDSASHSLWWVGVGPVAGAYSANPQVTGLLALMLFLFCAFVVLAQPWQKTQDGARSASR
jgi:hypothetical protein